MKKHLLGYGLLVVSLLVLGVQLSNVRHDLATARQEIDTRKQVYENLRSKLYDGAGVNKGEGGTVIVSQPNQGRTFFSKGGLKSETVYWWSH